jgi:hypothetical protein
MGKHEVIKPRSTSTERVRKYRAEMRAKGYRQRQLWVPDLNDPVVLARVQEECRAISKWESDNPDEVAMLDEMMQRNWDTLPE